MEHLVMVITRWHGNFSNQHKFHRKQSVIFLFFINCPIGCFFFNKDLTKANMQLSRLPVLLHQVAIFKANNQKHSSCNVFSIRPFFLCCYSRNKLTYLHVDWGLKFNKFVKCKIDLPVIKMTRIWTKIVTVSWSIKKCSLHSILDDAWICLKCELQRLILCCIWVTNGGFGQFKQKKLEQLYL